MYCYCENNCLLSSDPTGYWDRNDHVSITKYNGFWGNTYSVVQNWVYNADSYPCKSTKDYSTPFHGRSNALEIGKKLFNLALKVKSSSKKLKFTFENKKKGYESISFLKYIKKNGGNKNKTNKAQEDLLKILNNKDNSKKTQTYIILGLSLHTIQDYFAHVVLASAQVASDKYYGNKNKKTYNNLKMFEINQKMKMSTLLIEDNPSVFPWRIQSAKSITQKLSEFWTKNKKISKIYCASSNNQYTYKLYYERRTINSITPEYWVLTSMQYIWYIS